LFSDQLFTTEAEAKGRKSFFFSWTILGGRKEMGKGLHFVKKKKLIKRLFFFFLSPWGFFLLLPGVGMSGRTFRARLPILFAEPRRDGNAFW
jgi:hypothetical protein